MGIRPFKPLLFFMTWALSLQAAETVKTTFDDYFSNALSNHRVPGAAVSIIENGKPVYERGFGVLNVDTKAPINEGTLFQMNSVSKVFTAAVLLKLMEENRISP